MSTFALDNYVIQTNVGEGSFAQVFLAIHKKTGARVSIKVIPKQSPNAEENYLLSIQRELQILQMVNHPFIAHLYEIIENDEYYFVVMEYVQNGTLLNYINEKASLKEQEAARIFAQLVMVLQYLHETCNVCHRDIKAENILLDMNFNIRVIDFGLSNISPGNLMNTQCGSPAYASPEMILGQQYTFSSDIWSTGCVLYAMCCGKLPFYDENISRLAQKIVYAEPSYPPTLTPMCSDLLKKMLTKKASERITLEEIMNHPWVHHNVMEMTEVINKFEYDEELLKERLHLFGLEKQQVDQDVKAGVVNQGTVSYTIIKREFLMYSIHQIKSSQVNHPPRYGSIIKLDALPRLSKLDKCAPARRRSLTITYNPQSLIAKRRCPSMRLN